MEAPAITRRRRPFLVPIWLSLLLPLVLIGAAIMVYASANTTTIALVRHAERTLGTIEDPPLTQQGELRAEQLARIFGETKGPGRIHAVYVTQTRRVQQTAAPLAARLQIRPTIVDASDIDGLARRLSREHRGAAALVIGHSNTIPALIEKLSGIKVDPIGEQEYDTVYIVSIPSIGKPSLLRMKY
jgi:broad specificity phosphatase PhoE